MSQAMISKKHYIVICVKTSFENIILLKIFLESLGIKIDRVSHIYNWFSRRSTATGSCTSHVTVGPTKVKGL